MPESNISDYYFWTSGTGDDFFKVMRFSGIEEMNRPYTFSIQVECTDPQLDYEKLLDQPARLTIHAPGGTGRSKRVYHGIVSSVTLTGKEIDRVTYMIEMVPRLWRMGLKRNHRIFQDLSIPDVIREVLKLNDLKDGSDFEFKPLTEGNYHVRAYICQYNETDLDFVQRLLESQGIAYCFEQKDEQEFIIFSDNGQGANKSTQPISTLRFRDPSAMVPQSEETIFQLEFQKQAVTSKVSLRDHNFKIPGTLDATKTGNGPDKYEDYLFPGGFFVPDHGDRLAERRVEQYEVTRQTVFGASDCRSLSAGFQVEVTEHYRGELNRKYLLTQVSHSGVDASIVNAPGQSNYGNSFKCIPADLVFRPAMITPKAMVHGIQTATVTGPAGEKLYMDDLGRAKVKFHWDRSDTKDEFTSAYLRVATLYAGKQHGIQFHPLIGDEVIVEFQEGDPDRPMVTGRVYNLENLPPLKPANRIQNVIYTPYQHRLMFDDKGAHITMNTGGGEVLNMADGDSSFGNNIKMNTADNHSIQLAKGGSLNGIEAKTEGGHRAIMDDENKWIQITTTGKHDILMSDESEPGIYMGTTAKNLLYLSDASKICYMASTNEHQMSIDDNSNSINLALKGGHIVQLAGDGKTITIQSKNKNIISIDDNANNLTIQDKSGNHTIQIQDDGAKIMVHAKTGDILVNAASGKLDLHGKEVSISADTKVTIKGMDVESAADMTHTTKGNAVMSTGTATNTIKGGMVHLNP